MLPRPMIKILLVCTPDDGMEWGSRWAYWMKEGSWGRSQRFLKQKSTLILQLALDCSERGFSRKEEVLRGLPNGANAWWVVLLKISKKCFSETP